MAHILTLFYQRLISGVPPKIVVTNGSSARNNFNSRLWKMPAITSVYSVKIDEPNPSAGHFLAVSSGQPVLLARREHSVYQDTICSILGLQFPLPKSPS